MSSSRIHPSMVVRVHAPDRTPRHEAAFDWVLTSVLGLAWRWEDNVDDYQNDVGGIRCHYGASLDLSGVAFPAEGLLSELGQLRPKAPEMEGENADLFAAAFWMGSRMEEFLPQALRDDHGRFDPTGSESAKKGWLTRPVCEEWAFRIGEKLLGEEAWPAHRKRLLEAYRVEPTLDVDSAYAFRGKGAYRTFGATFRDLLRGKLRHVLRRWAVIMGQSKDPYDTYNLAGQCHDEHALKVRWFFLLADFGPFDKGLPSSSPLLARLMRTLEGQEANEVHWHPGYQSASDGAALKSEFKAFERIMGRPPQASRQHYLRLEPTHSRRRLLDLGIQQDHTEGHAKCVGWRGGFARHRRWYDLEAETLTDLELYPFAAMDATFLRYMKVPPEDVPQEMGVLADAVRKTGGPLRFLWHNESLCPEDQWRHWGQVYPAVLRSTCER